MSNEGQGRLNDDSQLLAESPTQHAETSVSQYEQHGISFFVGVLLTRSIARASSYLTSIRVPTTTFLCLPLFRVAWAILSPFTEC